MAQTPLTDVERCAHYRQLAVQFRDWAASESNQQARDGLTDMALQYDRLGHRTDRQNRSGNSGETGLISA